MFFPTRNPNPNNSSSSNSHHLSSGWRSLIMTSFLILLSSFDVLFADSGRNQSLQWEILTQKNLSSQIRIHEHALLIVTVPWCGESRALMKDIAHLVAYEPDKFGSLKLMVLYRNTEKNLASVLGAREGITIICYHHSVSFKYQGRHRAQNILSSFHHLLSLQPEEIPMKLLNTPEALNTFLESTDKAVLLLEVCGWTSLLLNKGKDNGSDSAYWGRDASNNGLINSENFSGDINQTLTSSGRNSEKFDGFRNEKLTCGVEKGLNGSPLRGELFSANGTALSKTENTRPDVGLSCTFEEFHRFESFFPVFKTIAREFFLPPQRHRFGVVTERSLLSSLGVEEPGSWLVMLNFAGCPNCSKILKEGDDLKSVLRMHQVLVSELEAEFHDLDPALPEKEPSIILFVDRYSESAETRQKSKEALDTFRKFALHNSVIRAKFSGQSFKGVESRSTSNPSENSVKQFTQPAQLDKLMNKISVSFVKEGESVTLDNILANSHGKSIHGILAHLLQQKKEAKLSVLAKEVGFQLLSGDFEVKIANLLPPNTETTQSGKLIEPHMEAIVESSINLNSDNLINVASITSVDPGKQPELVDIESSNKLVESSPEAILESSFDLYGDSMPNTASITPVDPGEQPRLTDSESYPHYSEEKTLVEHTQFIPAVQPTQITRIDVFDLAEDTTDDDRSPEFHSHNFKGFYFFADADFQLLRSLTSGLKIPSMVIVDPISQQHYVFSEEACCSYYSLVGFLDGFVNGSLLPYQRSEPTVMTSREATKPPFVNLDFHEVDSIPRVTANKFAELVLGINKSDTENVCYAWKKDVLVLFSNNWCGFCQRMELVVREVFRAFKSYLNMLNSGSKNRESTYINDNLKGGASHELPLIFLMDCTLNDCSSLFKSMGQRELYPRLMLFPAQRKNAVPFQGDMSVTNIIKFITDHGSHSHHLQSNKGFLWTGGQKEGINLVSSKDATPPSVHEEDPSSKSGYHEVLLNDRTPTRSLAHPTARSLSSNEFQGTINVVVGSILISTDKLLNAPNFDNSKILIVHANRSTGFQGLIINKHITWNSLQVRDKELQHIKQAPLSFGGPLMSQQMPLAGLVRGVTQEGYQEIFPGIYFVDQYTTTKELEGFKTPGTFSADNHWFFLGYSSWGWDQLFGEIAEGDWHIHNNPEGIFDWPEN